MDERPMDQPPVINTFSVSAVSRINDRCTASDPEGDPIIVEWFCRSGLNFAPITNQSGGLARCTAGYIWPDAISVYARVSDGNNVVWSEERLLYMLEFLQ
jgi:hypothetical protein